MVSKAFGQLVAIRQRIFFLLAANTAGALPAATAPTAAFLRKSRRFISISSELLIMYEQSRIYL